MPPPVVHDVAPPGGSVAPVANKGPKGLGDQVRVPVRLDGGLLVREPVGGGSVADLLSDQLPQRVQLAELPPVSVISSIPSDPPRHDCTSVRTVCKN